MNGFAILISIKITQYQTFWLLSDPNTHTADANQDESKGEAFIVK